MSRPYSLEPHAVLLAVRVTPRAKRSALGGIVEAPDGRLALAARLAAPPVEGAANKALIEQLALVTGLSKSSITIRSGETGRLKMIELRGDPEAIAARLETRLNW